VALCAPFRNLGRGSDDSFIGGTGWRDPVTPLSNVSISSEPYGSSHG